MNSYFVDTNVFLRFFLKDNLQQFVQAKQLFTSAQQGTIKLICAIEVLVEMEYVLRKYYKRDRVEIAGHLGLILSLSFLEIPDKVVMQKALNIYIKKSIDLVDCILYFKAQLAHAKIFSFDKDFTKIE